MNKWNMPEDEYKDMIEHITNDLLDRVGKLERRENGGLLDDDVTGRRTTPPVGGTYTHEQGKGYMPVVEKTIGEKVMEAKRIRSDVYP